MTNVHLTWVIPAPGARQAPVHATIIEGRVVSDPVLPWTRLNTVPAPVSELVLENVDPGMWEYRAVAVDKDGRAGANPPTVVVDMPFELPPDVTSFTAVIE